MADFRYRYPQNVPGKFYTDILRLDCYACRKIAPAIFRRDEVLNIPTSSSSPRRRRNSRSATNVSTAARAG